MTIKIILSILVLGLGGYCVTIERKDVGKEEHLQTQIDSLNRAANNEAREIEALQLLVISERHLVKKSQAREDSLIKRHKINHAYHNKERRISRAVVDSSYANFFTGVIRAH